jgi:tetratricopeptide (TPR) repeat protein
VSFNVTADIDKKIMAQIDEAMKGEKKPYYSAANYYYENGKDLDKALEWINEAIKTRPEAFWMTHLKAKILLKKGDYDAAIEAAKLSIEKAKEAKNDDYVAMNEKLIADAEKMKTKKK